MELRPIQAALLAGRSASRRAATTPSPLSYTLTHSFYRSFSSTRPSLSEAEAAAPTPTPSMQEWSRQQQQQQQQQQQSQEQQQSPQQPRTWGTTNGYSSPNMASLLRPRNLTATSPTSSILPTAPGAPSSDSRRAPWAEPTSTALRRAQANRAANEVSSRNDVDSVMADLIKTSDITKMPGTPEPVSEIKYRLRPSVGRSFQLDTKTDLARGLALLNTRVRVNKVNQDLVRQRFHERPGLKRKRLRSERWRARFKEGFKATCSRVKELARQGW